MIRKQKLREDISPNATIYFKKIQSNKTGKYF